jgi:hypothetical protein
MSKAKIAFDTFVSNVIHRLIAVVIILVKVPFESITEELRRLFNGMESTEKKETGTKNFNQSGRHPRLKNRIIKATPNAAGKFKGSGDVRSRN